MSLTGKPLSNRRTADLRQGNLQLPRKIHRHVTDGFYSKRGEHRGGRTQKTGRNVPESVLPKTKQKQVLHGGGGLHLNGGGGGGTKIFEEMEHGRSITHSSVTRRPHHVEGQVVRMARKDAGIFGWKVRGVVTLGGAI